MFFVLGGYDDTDKVFGYGSEKVCVGVSKKRMVLKNGGGVYATEAVRIEGSIPSK
jgi:hypothetical protein